MAATEEQFEKDGNTYKTIRLKETEDDKYGFVFGVRKARLVLDNVDAIRTFVEKNEVQEG